MRYLKTHASACIAHRVKDRGYCGAERMTLIWNLRRAMTAKTELSKSAIAVPNWKN
jgi:hypothetical protein